MSALAAPVAVLAQSGFPDLGWIADNRDVLLERGIEHVQLTLVAVLLGLAIAAPLAIWAQRDPRVQGPILTISGILFTIPSLALFVVLVPLTGLTATTALIPLTIYTLLILIRNIIAGLDGVPPEVVESAVAMGYRDGAVLTRIRLPLALPVIVAGIRIATVTTIGLVTVTALIGQGGWGQVILTGFRRDNPTATLTGFALCIVLAVVLDVLLVAIQRRLTPWSRS